MFANFIYFIVALLIYSTYQPSEAADLKVADTLWFFLGLAGLFAYFNWIQFRLLEKRLARDSFMRVDHQFNALLTRNSILAIVLFAVDLYGLHLPDRLAALPPFTAAPTLLALLFIFLFIGYLAVVWSFASGAYQRLYSPDTSRSAYVWSQISFSAPVLLPWLMLSGIIDLINALPFELPRKLLATTEGSTGIFMAFLMLAALSGPAVVQKFWRCRPLEAGWMRERIDALCRRAEMPYANILYWPIFGGRMITAGVMGLVKRFRYILVTRALLQTLSPEEIDAVIAHEIGHVKRKHLIFYLVFFAGFMLLTYAVYDLIIYLVIYAEPLFQFAGRLGFNPVTLTSVFLSLSMVLLFLVYFRFIFGYFMRNFERQADGYVYSLFASARPLISTLQKIAQSSGQDPNRPNWHHFSIAERIGYLSRCEIDRSTIRRHDRKIRRSIVAFAAAMLLVGAFGYTLNYGAAGKRLSSHFFEKIILRELEKHPDNANLYKTLGDLYYEVGNFEGVQQAYESSLAIDPHNPQVLNNLAWFYATVEDERLRDPVRALSLASRAAEILPESYVLDTLAESYFANGLYFQALEAARRALESAKENRAYYREQLERFEKSAGG